MSKRKCNNCKREVEDAEGLTVEQGWCADCVLGTPELDKQVKDLGG